jgi:DMSO reductase anchor subunit
MTSAGNFRPLSTPSLRPSIISIGIQLTTCIQISPTSKAFMPMSVTIILALKALTVRRNCFFG